VISPSKIGGDAGPFLRSRRFPWLGCNAVPVPRRDLSMDVVLLFRSARHNVACATSSFVGIDPTRLSFRVYGTIRHFRDVRNCVSDTRQGECTLLKTLDGTASSACPTQEPGPPNQLASASLRGLSGGDALLGTVFHRPLVDR
jgi:hypothetical protein